MPDILDAMNKSLAIANRKQTRLTLSLFQMIAQLEKELSVEKAKVIQLQIEVERLERDVEFWKGR